MQCAFAPSTLSREKLFERFFPGKIHGICHHQWLHRWWKHLSRVKNHEELHQIMSPVSWCCGSLSPWLQSLLTCFGSRPPAATIWGLGTQRSFPCSTALRTTASPDPLHWTGTSFPALKNSSSDVSIASNRRGAKMKEQQFLCWSKNLLLQVKSWL